MANHGDQPKDGKSSLKQAKRRFLLNLSFFACLVVAGASIFTATDEEVSELIGERPAARAPILSLSELAYVKGQMLGLSEHPGTMPKYEVDWVMKVSEQEIRRSPEFAEVRESEIPELSQEFFKGYTEKFDAYYNDDRARQAGYKYGLKFNPMIHGMLPFNPENPLLFYRDRLEANFEIQSEAEWHLFCQAFDQGFVQGYQIMEDGVTVQSRNQKISLLDE
jgi:hypothetical protein